MFNNVEYELLIKQNMSIGEHKNLVKTYKNELNILYITAKQYICLKQIKKIESKNNKKYEHAFLNTYYTISQMLL